MKINKLPLLLSVILILNPLMSVANATATGSQPISESYLEHWFSIDSAEPINMRVTPLENDSIGKRAKLEFTADDGASVNGKIAYPAQSQAIKKIAFALHPMGSNQDFWWSNKSPLAANQIVDHLRKQGFIVISLDARRHGERAVKDFGPRELLKRAHSDEPRLYIDTIIGSVRDYRSILKWSEQEFQATTKVVLGYSMGAQMSILLASYEPSINTVLAMVPPFVGSLTSPVAPRIHAHRITQAKVIWFAGRQDPHSNMQQTKQSFDRLATDDKELVLFDSAHRLPASYLQTANDFFDSIYQGEDK